MRRSALLCVLAVFFIQTAQSQTNSYYITASGDTMYGSIHLHRNANTFGFGSLENPGHVKTIHFDSCIMLSSPNWTYKNWFGKRSLIHVDKFTYEIKLSDKFITGRIPLKLLVKGDPLSLYHYKGHKDYFFAEIRDSIFELAMDYRYQTKGEKFIEWPRTIRENPYYLKIAVYKDQIVGIMNNNLTKAQMRLMEITEYEERSMRKLFKSLSK